MKKPSTIMAEMLDGALEKCIDLRLALLKYGGHTPECKCFSWVMQEVGPDWDKQCTCGWIQIKEESEHITDGIRQEGPDDGVPGNQDA